VLYSVGDKMEEFMEWKLTGEIEVSGENLLQGYFAHKSLTTWPRIEPVAPQYEAGGDKPPKIWHGPPVEFRSIGNCGSNSEEGARFLLGDPQLKLSSQEWENFLILSHILYIPNPDVINPASSLPLSWISSHVSAGGSVVRNML
jgi:hypothetical protein